MAAQALRLKQYPALPHGGPRLSIVLPTQGDLRLRSLLPAEFARQLAVHCTVEHSHVYTKFIVIRKFIVMSSDGDMFTQTLRTQLRIGELPGGALLPMPTALAPGDVVKVLDLVQCYTFDSEGVALVPNVRWELVRVRWRNDHETWIPIELMASQPPTLLQEFCMATANSWCFRDRLQPFALTRYPTEVELWVQQAEFHKFYEQLRRRLALLQGTNTNGAAPPQPANSTNGGSIQPPARPANDVKDPRLVQEAAAAAARPAVRAPIGAVRPAIHDRPNASAHVPTNSMRTPTPEQPRIPPVPTQTPNRSAPVPPPTPTSAPRPTPTGRTPPPTPPTANPPTRTAPRPTQKPTTSSTSRTPERDKQQSKSKPQKQKKKKKKKATPGVDAFSSNSDAFPPLSARKKKRRHQNGDDTDTSAPDTPTSRHRRLRWSQAAAASSDESDDLLELPQKRTKSAANADKKKKKKKKSKRSVDQLCDESSTKAKKSKSTKRKKSNVGASAIAPIVLSDSDDDEDTGTNTNVSNRLVPCIDADADADDYSDPDHVDSDADHVDTVHTNGLLLLGRIRCMCGAKSVGRYTGRWLQCRREDCGAWQHAECVGMLVKTQATDATFVCTHCDPIAYTERRRAAKLRLRKWLTLCCKAKNQRFLLQLLAEEEARDVRAAVDLAASVAGGGQRKRTLLMEAARNGLGRAVRRLVRRYQVNVFATDSQSRNVFHFVVEGKSVDVARFLHKQAPALVRHQDLSGRMPVHLLLQSPELNGFAVELLRSNTSLCVTSDFAGEMPIHYACRVVNVHTVDSVRSIVDVDPAAALQPSPVCGLTPLLLLCRVANGVDANECDVKARCINEIIAVLLERVDMLGRFLLAADKLGWTAIHYAAASGNDALVRLLSQRPGVEVDAIAFDTSETALHVAARGTSVDAVRALLENRGHRLSPVSVDASRFIPALRATDCRVLRALLCYDLEAQLQKVSELARQFQLREHLREWLSGVVGDPDCFDIVNDWLEHRVKLLDEVDELMFLHRSLVRVDTKLAYLYGVVFPSCQGRPHPQQPQGQAPANPSGYEVVLSAMADTCYWTQCVALLQGLDASVFQKPLRIVIARGDSVSRIDNPTLVLVRVLSGLLQPTTGLFVRDTVDATLRPSPLRKADDATTLTGFYVLGELLASLTLQKIPLGEVMEFSDVFLQCVVGLPPRRATTEQRVFADSFAAGFSAVLPSTLPLLHAHELRIVFHAKAAWSLQPLLVDWLTAIVWTGWDITVDGEDVIPAKATVVAWWTRLVQDLVDEERVALVLWLAGSYRHAQCVLFTSNQPAEGRVHVHLHPTAKASTTVDEDELLPTFENRTLVLPRYSTYADFRVGVLHVLRQVDHVATVR